MKKTVTAELLGLALLGAAVLLVCPPHAQAASVSQGELARELTHVTAGVHGNYERFVFHTTRAATVEQLDMVDRAIRIVLDNVAADDKVVAGGQPPLNDKFGTIKNVSYEQYTDGLLVLLALTDDAPAAPQTNIFVLSPDSYGGHRVVIDIAKPGKSLSVVAPASQPAARPKTETPTAETPDAEQPQNPFATQRLTDDGATTPANTPSPSTQSEGSMAAQTKADNNAAASAAQKATAPQPPISEPSAPEQHAALRPSEPAPPARGCEQHRTNLTAYGWSYKAAFDLADCLSGGHRWPEAAQVYEQILQRDPEFHRARLALADIYGRTGRIDQAKQAYLHVLATNPPTDVVKVIQLRMDALNQ